MKFDIDVTLNSEQFEELGNFITELIQKEVRRQLKKELKKHPRVTPV